MVKTVEAQMCADPMLNHEYLPLDGLKSFTEAAAKLLLGSDSPAFTQNRVCQTALLFARSQVVVYSMLQYTLHSGLELCTMYIYVNNTLVSVNLYTNVLQL